MAKHGNADALSRMSHPLVPCSAYMADIRPVNLPCVVVVTVVGQMHNGRNSLDDVDDAIELTVQAGKTINEVVYHKEVTVEMTDMQLQEEVPSVMDTCPSRFYWQRLKIPTN